MKNKSTVSRVAAQEHSSAERPRRARSYAAWLGACCAAALLAACGGGGGGTSAAGGVSTPTSSLSGSVMGGQSPVTGSTVVLWASGQVGGAATPIASTTTDASGKFTLGYTNPGGNSLLYVTAYQGNAGAGTNSELQMAAALGVASGVNASTSVTVNELTTVAFADAFGTSYTSAGVEGATSQQASIAAALVDASTGAFNPALLSAANAATVETLTLKADVLASCVQSSGASGGNCSTIKADSGGTADVFLGVVNWATSFTTVNWSALYALAQANPVFDQSSYPISALASGLPQIPYVNITAPSSSPNALQSPQGIVFDQQCNAWVGSSLSANGYLSKISVGSPGFAATAATAADANFLVPDGNGGFFYASAANGSVADFSAGSIAAGNLIAPSGQLGGTFTAPLTGMATDPSLTTSSASVAWVAEQGGVCQGTTGYAVNQPCYAVSNPGPVAVDASGNLFVGSATSAVVWLIPKGTAPGYPSVGGITGNQPTISCSVGGVPSQMAVDSSGNVWVLSESGNTLSEIGAVGAGASSCSVIKGWKGFQSPDALAIDGGGNVWVANSASGGIDEIPASNNYYGSALMFTNATISAPSSLAVDPLGDLWVANIGNNSVTVLFGVAAPTGACTPPSLGQVWKAPTSDANWNPPIAPDASATAASSSSASGGGWGLDWSGMYTGINFFD